MKYFIAKIEERNGEYEYSHIHTFRAVNMEKAAADHEIYTSTFYGSEAEKADGGYYFHAGSIFVSTGDIKEISSLTHCEINAF